MVHELVRYMKSVNMQGEKIKVVTDIWKSLCESWICFTWTRWDISKYSLGSTCR